MDAAAAVLGAATAVIFLGAALLAFVVVLASLMGGSR